MLTSITRLQAIGLSTLIVLGLGMYHSFIVAGFISSQYVWLGMIESNDSLVLHETISLTLIFIVLIALFLEYFNMARKMTQAVFYIFSVVFGINTILNLFAPTLLEQVVFTFLTLVMSVMMLRLGSTKDAQ